MVEIEIGNIKSVLHEMSTSLSIQRDREARLLAEKKDIEKRIGEINVSDYEKALYVLQKLSETQRNAAKESLEELGTQALQYSMGSNYEMKIDIDNTKKRPQAFLYVRDIANDMETDPLEENGGGIVDIISIALKVITLQVSDPVIDGPLIFDEPFKMVSKEYIPMLAEFLKKISKDFSRQIIMSTHNEYLAESCDTKIVLERAE